jgi:N-acetylglucosamine malate deacetylase 1
MPQEGQGRWYCHSSKRGSDTPGVSLDRARLAGDHAFMATAPNPQPASPLKLLFTGAHPGDPEYGCGGTIARYTALGHQAVLLYLNRGEAGIPGKSAAEAAAIRTAEAQAACQLLGARAAFAPQIDGQGEVNASRYDQYLQLIAQEKPDALFSHWPIDNHPDHRVNALLAYDAWLRLGRTFGLYYYEVSNGADTLHFAPTQYVDISSVEPLKRSACFAHASQAPESFYRLQDQVSRFRGVESGHAHAEAFIRLVQSPDTALPLIG